VLDYQRLGSRVIVIEGAGQVAGNEDPEIAAALQQLLENEGVEFRLNTQVTRIRARAVSSRRSRVSTRSTTSTPGIGSTRPSCPTGSR